MKLVRLNLLSGYLFCKTDTVSRLPPSCLRSFLPPLNPLRRAGAFFPFFCFTYFFGLRYVFSFSFLRFFSAVHTPSRHQAKGGKQNRNEKKARKAVQKLGMKAVPSIVRVTAVSYTHLTLPTIYSV